MNIQNVVRNQLKINKVKMLQIMLKMLKAVAVLGFKLGGLNWG